jgi:prefoldin subunit 5
MIMGKYFPKAVVARPVSVQMILMEAVEDIDSRINAIDKRLNELEQKITQLHKE